jgi:hypothetical protein
VPRALSPASLVALLSALAAAAPALAQSRAAIDRDPATGVSRLLDVPFVAQVEDLCGGAALAMVRRYWGDTSALAEDFGGLVDRGEGAGIRTSRLADAAGAAGWTAVALAGGASDGARVASQVARGRPVIALIVDRPGVFHYVVVVGWTGTEVILHDPARRPFETVAREEFDRRWASAGRWMLLVVPARVGLGDADGVVGVRGNADHSAASPGGSRCRGAIDRAIEVARAGSLDEAAASLDEASRLCPGEAAVWRELAGVRFLQRQWTTAEALAVHAAMLDPDDRDAWRLVGASRFMTGDRAGALEAFNQAGEPAIDRVLVDGASQTPDPVVTAATGLRPRQVLTPAEFARATRRLAALPVVSRSALRYGPAAAGTAMTVHASVQERHAFPSGWPGWGVIGSRAVFTETLEVALAGPARSGEVWRGEWRWADERPRVAFAIAMPAPGAPGVATVEASWEQQSFAGDGLLVRQQTRRRVSAGLSDWASGALHWRTAIAFDRIDDASYVALSGGIDRRWGDDRVSLTAGLERWVSPRGGTRPFGRGIVTLALRSSPEPVPMLSARAGVALASSDAPLVVWPTAGTGSDSLAPLRAHPLRQKGVVSGTGLGRQIAYGSFELARPLVSRGSGRAWLASFVDLASIGNRGGGGPVLHLDVGTGLRVQIPGFDGTIHLDAAYGVRDGNVRFSAAVRRGWPGTR